MKACPYRADLYAKLGTPDKVDVELEKWLTALEGIVVRIQKFYEKGNYGKGLWETLRYVRSVNEDLCSIEFASLAFVTEPFSPLPLAMYLC